jgi:hypothetical protein
MKFGGHFVRLAASIKRDRLTNVVHDDLTGIAPFKVILKFLANRRVDVPVHVFVESLEQIFAFHGNTSFAMPVNMTD